MDKPQDQAVLALNHIQGAGQINDAPFILNPIQHYTKASLYKAYKDSEQQNHILGKMLDSIYEIMFVLDDGNQIHYFNKNAAVFFKKAMGYTFKVGEYFLQGLKHHASEYWQELLGRMEGAFEFEERFETHVGEQIYHFHLQVSPEFGESGKISKRYFFCQDITEEMREQEKRRLKQSMFESISNSVQEGIFRSTRDHGIIYVNQAFARMFGYDNTEEILRVDPSELYMDANRRDDFVRIVQEKGSFFNEEVEFKRKDGSGFWGLISSVPCYDKLGNRYHDGAIRDVTQLKEVERGLKDNYKELQKVNRELDRFVYSTSHDLRAPLATLSGLISITRQESREKKRNEYLDHMETSIQKLDDFIRDIIGYSRNSRLELKYEPVDFEILLQDTLDALSPKAGENLVEKITQVKTSGTFYSDLGRLKTIFNNLLSNAFRYADPEKEVSAITIDILQDEDQAVLKVSDNGIGIEEKYLDKIFQMFYRATQKSKGSGIGLYIVKEAVEKLGGSISVRSELGVGTEFEVKIPAGERRE